MTELEKKIYNTYLVTSRKSQNQPFSIRKDFEKFEEDPKYPYVSRISNIFKKLPYINMDDYFWAPYEVYKHDSGRVFGLDFYASLKALHTYKQYMKILEMSPVDEERQLQFIVESFRFILRFCSDHKITFDEYLDYRIGFTPEWMKHYVENKISIYCLLDIPDIYDRMMGIEDDHRKLLLGDLEGKFYTFKDRFLKSKKAKELVKKGIELLRKQTDKNKK